MQHTATGYLHTALHAGQQLLHHITMHSLALPGAMASWRISGVSGMLEAPLGSPLAGEVRSQMIAAARRVCTQTMWLLGQQQACCQQLLCSSIAA
jgi:hypothetical protein